MLKIHKSELAGALRIVSTAIESRGTIPILQNVLLAPTKDGRVTLTGTNLDVAVDATINAEIERDAVAFTLPAAPLQAFVKNLVAGDVAFKIDGSSVTIRSGRARASIPFLPASDFPTMRSVNDMVAFDIDAKDFVAGLNGTAFAISTEETRYYLNGTFFHQLDSHPGCLAMVATDGSRLSRRVVPVASELPAFAPGIVPIGTVKILTRQLDGKDTARVEISDAIIRVTTGDVRLTSKLIDGTFPDYMRVVPRDQDIRLPMDRDALSSALSRVLALQASDESQTIWRFGEANLMLSARSKSSGSEAEEDVAIVAGPDLTICFNGRFMSEALAQLPATFNACFAGAGDPALLLDPAHPENMIVVMPVRIGGAA